MCLCYLSISVNKAMVDIRLIHYVKHDVIYKTGST